MTADEWNEKEYQDQRKETTGWLPCPFVAAGLVAVVALLVRITRR